METILLIVLLLLVGVVLYLLIRLDTKVQDLQEEEEVDDDQAELVQRIEEMDQLLRQLDPEPARQALLQLERSVALLEESRAAAPVQYGAELPRVAEVRAMVEAFLRQRGCDAVHILNPEAELDVETVEVRIEAQRAGQVLKGTLRVSGTEVRETHLDSSFSLFP